MSELPDRARRAFRDHDAFTTDDVEGATDLETDQYVATSTPFEGTVDAGAVSGGRISFAVTVRVPMLDEVIDGDVAPVVEEGWYETFERRLASIGGGVLAGDNIPDLAVETTTDDGTCIAEVGTAFEDIDPNRGVNDAAALIDFVEGTYVQGVIPGYDYLDPVAGILSEARRAGGSDGVEQ